MLAPISIQGNTSKLLYSFCYPHPFTPDIIPSLPSFPVRFVGTFAPSVAAASGRAEFGLAVPPSAAVEVPGVPDVCRKSLRSTKPHAF